MGEGEKKCGKYSVADIRSALHNCHEIKHWARVCRNSRSVNDATETEGEQTSYFLGLVCGANEQSEAWTVQLLVHSIPVEFKIDTGTDVNLINEHTLHTFAPEKRRAVES